MPVIENTSELAFQERDLFGLVSDKSRNTMLLHTAGFKAQIVPSVLNFSPFLGFAQFLSICEFLFQTSGGRCRHQQLPSDILPLIKSRVEK